MDPLSAVSLATTLADLGAKLWRFRKEAQQGDGKQSQQAAIRDEIELRLNEAVEALLKSHADLSARQSVLEQENQVVTAVLARIETDNRILRHQLRWLSGIMAALVVLGTGIACLAYFGRVLV